METITVEKRDHTLYVTLNRPDVRNAFDDKMIAELTQVFVDTKKDFESKVLFLRGEGESFCAGADLNWMKSMVQYSKQENVDDSRKLRDMYVALNEVPFPVVGLIHGHAFGGALGLVALCDIVAAEATTLFSFSEVRLGLAPAVVSEFAMQKISRAHLQRWFLTAEAFNATEAKEMGLVNFVGQTKPAMEFVEGIIEKIGKNGPQAVRATKKLIGKMYDTPEGLDHYTVDLIASLRVGEEGQEGLKSFFEKRKPNWTN